jgi:hypothetical protein
MPHVLIDALLVLGIALADTQPDEARACLDESLDRRVALGYENANTLGLSFVLVSRLDDARDVAILRMNLSFGAKPGADASGLVRGTECELRHSRSAVPRAQRRRKSDAPSPPVIRCGSSPHT